MPGSRRAFVVGAAATLAGCGPQVPTYQDPLADLTTARGAAVPENAPVSAGPTQALTFGSNVERFIKYHDDGTKFAASMGAGQKMLADASPQYLVDGGVAILRQRYPQLKPVNDLATAARERIATTFVLDIQTKAGTLPGTQSTVDIIVIAVDAQQKPISRIRGHGFIVIPGFVAPDLKVANDMALADLRSKVDQLYS